MTLRGMYKLYLESLRGGEFMEKITHCETLDRITNIFGIVSEKLDLITLLERIATMSSKPYSKSFITLWTYNIFSVGIIDQEILISNPEKIPSDLKHIFELRVFNEIFEIKLFKRMNALNFRIRVDGELDVNDLAFAQTITKEIQNNCVYYDSHIILHGTKGEILDGEFCRIYEDRGIEYLLPAKVFADDINKFLNKLNNGEIRLALKVRNYLDTNEIGQYQIIDERFVAFLEEEV